MNTYVHTLKKHLANYKKTRLGIAENGIWGKNGKPYDHILPENLLKLNIIETIRREFWDYASQTKPNLHLDFHHLNSSQAMCFNLFYPFLQIDAGRSEWLEVLLGFQDDRITQFRFEHVLDSCERTNFDLVLSLRSGRTVLVETKLSESGFAGKKPDVNSHRRLRDLYHERLQRKVLPACLAPKFFFANYQLLRNISYVETDKSSLLYLVVPKANEAFHDTPRMLHEMLVKEIQPNVRILYIEDLVAAIEHLPVERTSFLQEHFHLFAEKYVVLP